MQGKLEVFICRRYGHDSEAQYGALIIAALNEKEAEKVFRVQEGNLPPQPPEKIEDVFAVGNPRVLLDYSL